MSIAKPKAKRRFVDLEIPADSVEQIA